MMTYFCICAHCVWVPWLISFLPRCHPHGGRKNDDESIWGCGAQHTCRCKIPLQNEELLRIIDLCEGALTNDARDLVNFFINHDRKACRISIADMPAISSLRQKIK